MIGGGHTGPRCAELCKTQNYSPLLPPQQITPGPKGGSAQQPRHQEVETRGVRNLLSVPIGLLATTDAL